MKTDRELLELAAKAVGMNTREFATDSITRWHWRDDGTHTAWNPLTDDGDALRLAVRLSLLVDVTAFSVTAMVNGVISAKEKHDGDPYAATRRAITRAAAAIGEVKK